MTNMISEGALLNGLVEENQLGGRSMAGVKVWAPGSNATQTSEEGFFSLSFPNKSPGDAVEVKLTKEGYRVVNRWELRTILPRFPDEDLLKLVICNEAELPIWIKRYVESYVFPRLEESYQRELLDSRTRGRVAIDRGDLLGQEYELAKEVVTKRAVAFATNPAEEPPEQEWKSLKLVTEGQVNEALEMLRSVKNDHVSRSLDNLRNSWRDRMETESGMDRPDMGSEGR